jgi:hypothetical protein
VKRSGPPEGEPFGPPESEPTASEAPGPPEGEPSAPEPGTSRPRAVCSLALSTNRCGAAPKNCPCRSEDRPIAPKSDRCPSEEGRRRPQLRATGPGRVSRRHCVHKRRTSPKAVWHALSRQRRPKATNQQQGGILEAPKSPSVSPSRGTNPTTLLGGILEAPKSLSVSPPRGANPTA